MNHTHIETRSYPQGYVAWCSCGVGSLAKPTPNDAQASLEPHLLDPKAMPR